jgi:hemoglobin-like flavoprotein
MTREEVLELALQVSNGKVWWSINKDTILEIADAVAVYEREQYEGVIRELLEALEEVLGWETLCPIEVYEQAREAIAKAKGES